VLTLLLPTSWPLLLLVLRRPLARWTLQGAQTQMLARALSWAQQLVRCWRRLLALLQARQS
jgi:hypothetical protein